MTTARAGSRSKAEIYRPEPVELRCGRITLSLARPLLMGVINITPDSFSDGGQFLDVAHAVRHARQLVEEGADLLDIGGESSRPGAEPVALDEERKRILPVLERIADLRVAISVDTYKPELMREAIAAGASMINDIFGLRTPGAMEAIAGSDAAVCIMHMQGNPKSMQLAPHYDDVVAEVGDFLLSQARALMDKGVERSRIVLDPGFGFGKTPLHNLALLRAMPELAGMGFPVLAGLSRKSLLGKISGRPVGQRVHESVAAALSAAQRGAAILRVHDVAATRAALLVQQAIDNDQSAAIENK